MNLGWWADAGGRYHWYAGYRRAGVKALPARPGARARWSAECGDHPACLAIAGDVLTLRYGYVARDDSTDPQQLRRTVQAFLDGDLRGVVLLRSGAIAALWCGLGSLGLLAAAIAVFRSRS